MVLTQRYRSRSPTKERKAFYDFMESQKTSGQKGIVSTSKVEKYVYKKALIPMNRGKGNFTLLNRHGTRIADIKKKRSIVWWKVY